MEIKTKVRSIDKQRKAVEIPKAVRDNFSNGEVVLVKKIMEKKNE